MNRLIVSLLTLLVSCTLHGQRVPTQKKTSLLLQHVTVIDSAAGSVHKNVSVLIVGDTIKSITSHASPKPVPGAVVVDGTGKFLIAGLWDMHVHTLNKGQAGRFLPLFIANGVTGIRDMGGDIPLEDIARLKKEISNGEKLGPQIFAPGPILEGKNPFWRFSVSVDGPDAARQSVASLAAGGADFLKVYNTLSRDSYLAIATQAKVLKIPFVGHIPDGVTPEEASRFGQKSIEHLWGIPNYLSSEAEQLSKLIAAANDAEDAKVARDSFYDINQKILATYDPRKAQKLFDEFARNQTWQTPTLVVLRSYARIHDPNLRNDSRMAFIPDDLLRFWDSMGGQPDARNDEVQLRLFNHNLEIVRAMHAARVPLLAGTDFPNPYTYPGSSLHEELELLVSAGLSPGEALTTATLRAAEFLGVQRQFGSVQVGKIANLVLLDANPLDDIRNTRKIRGVILRGKLLDRATLDALLDQGRRSHDRN